MTTIKKIQYRIKIRMQFQKADMELLKITNEELHKEFERRNKNK